MDNIIWIILITHSPHSLPYDPAAPSLPYVLVAPFPSPMPSPHRRRRQPLTLRRCRHHRSIPSLEL
jgi:hypothetical protein